MIRGWRKGGPLRAAGANILALERKPPLENRGLNFQGGVSFQGYPLIAGVKQELAGGHWSMTKHLATIKQ